MRKSATTAARHGIVRQSLAGAIDASSGQSGGIRNVRRPVGLFALGWALVLLGGLLAHLIQTAGGVAVQDVRWTGSGGEHLSALLYVPSTATPRKPAPAVLVSHGYINTREMQSPFAIELARRGFVVLAMDMSGHGYSDGAVGDHDGGGPDALTYLRSLPFVDGANIGLEGHSMGGVPIVGAAVANPDGYRSMVLEGSTTPEFGQVGAGTPRFPRNLEIVFGQYDEFAPLMWREPKGSLVGASAKMRALFGAARPVSPGEVSGSIPEGTARLLVNPPITHPMEHFTAAGVGAAVDWFQRTLSGEAHAKPPGHQIWFWKEIGTLTALIGFVAVVLGAFELLLAAPPFAGLRAGVSGAPVPERSRFGWWLSFVLTAALPALTFYPLMGVGFGFFPSKLFPEWVSNQLVTWIIANAAISGVLLFLGGRRRVTFNDAWAPSILIAVLSAGTGYVAVMVADALFKVDFRFWVLGLKLADARHTGYFLAYLPFFTLAFLVALRALQANLAIRGQGATAQYAAAITAMCSGFLVLLTVQYLSLFATGRLLNPPEALNTIIAIQFVPILAVVGLISVFTYRRTGGFVSGAFLCAILVTWYIVAGTATHWRPGWTVPKSAGLYPARPVAVERKTP
jgi:pimeloyl-ACP methyl ester carboxylesterase